jgi:hypothetical protein
MLLVPAVSANASAPEVCSEIANHVRTASGNGTTSSGLG